MATSTLCIGISHILLHISTLFWIPDPMVGGGLEPLFPPSRSGNVFPTMSTHTCLHLFHAQANIPQQSHQLQLWQAFNFSPIGNSTPFIEYFTVRNSICTEGCKFPNQPKPKSAFKAFYLHNINNSLGKWSFINWSLLKLQYFAAFLPLLNTGWVSVWPYGICQNFPQVLIHLLDPLTSSYPQQSLPHSQTSQK